jgi:hypothetical protein
LASVVGNLRLGSRYGAGPRRLDVLVEALLAAVAAKARLAVAAKAGGGVEHVVRVDPDGAGLDRHGDLLRRAP